MRLGRERIKVNREGEIIGRGGKLCAAEQAVAAHARRRILTVDAKLSVAKVTGSQRRISTYDIRHISAQIRVLSHVECLQRRWETAIRRRQRRELICTETEFYEGGEFAEVRY